MSNELKDCPFCGCKMIVRSNRDWHQPEGDHNELCPVYESDLMFPATDQGLSALYAMWNMRPSSTSVSSAAPSGEPVFPLSVLDAIAQEHAERIPGPGGYPCSTSEKEAFKKAFLKRWMPKAAIAHQPPKEAMTEKVIAEMWKTSCIEGGDTTQALVLHFARAIEAASAPNKQLVAALRNFTDGCSVSVDAVAVARAALAAAGEKGE